MHDSLTLALDFLDEHPDAAVRILEQHDAAQVAAFLLTVPDTYSVRVFARALVAFTAHLCGLLPMDKVVPLLLELDLSRMVAILRYLDRDKVDAILLESPKSRRAACLMLLHFSLNSVGAWMVPNSAVVSSDFTVAEVLTFLKDATEETVSKYVFVVNRDGMPEGRVSYLSLLKARPGLQVVKLMEPGAGTISGQMLLTQAAKLPCWDIGDVMPVTGLHHQYIGVLRHADLRRGLQYLKQSNRTSPGVNDPLSGIIDVYGQSLLALFNSVSNVVENDADSSKS